MRGSAAFKPKFQTRASGGPARGAAAHLAGHKASLRYPRFEPPAAVAFVEGAASQGQMGMACRREMLLTAVLQMM
jgi:hypothetical protein